jgi:hypothetical protein
MVGEAGRNKLVKSLLHIWPQWLAGLKPFVSICSHAPRITNHLGDQCFKRMMRNRLRRQPMLRRSDHRGQLRPSDLKCCTHTPLCLRLGHPDHLAGAGRLGPNKPDVLADVGRLLFKPDCALRHAKGNCAVRKSPGLRPCDLSARPVARGSCKDDPRRPALSMELCAAVRHTQVIAPQADDDIGLLERCSGVVVIPENLSTAHHRSIASCQGSLVLDAEFGFHQRLHGLRVGLAAGCLHHLADEPAGELGLALACSTLSGLAAMTSSTASMAPVSVTCFMPRSSTIRRVAALVPDDLEQVLGDLAGNGALLDQVDDAAELGGRNRRLVDAEPSLFRRRADR